VCCYLNLVVELGSEGRHLLLQQRRAMLECLFDKDRKHMLLKKQ
jgi:hypothetical protein